MFMDALPDPFIPTPLEGPPLAPPMDNRLDPLAGALDWLEASVERQCAPLDRLLADPLARTLDRVEASIMPPAPLDEWPQGVQEPSAIRDIVGELEGFIPTPQPISSAGGATTPAGHQAFGTTKPRPGTPWVGPLTSETADGMQPMRVPRPLAEPQKPSGIDETHNAFQRQYREPSYHRMGHRTGIRHSSSQPEHYCNFREGFVSSGECASCEQFEETEDTASQESERRCRHRYWPPTAQPEQTRTTAEERASDD
jgi:hypothetical protein